MTTSVKSVVSTPLMTLIGLSIAVLIISNVASVKLTSLGSYEFDAGTILFPLAYVLGDIITEIYGYKTARRVVFVGFGCLLLMALTFLVVQHLPSGPNYSGQAAYEQVLGFAPRIALGSMIAFLVGELTNTFLMARLKARLKGKQLWSRLMGSSGLGELLDTIIFSSVAFAGTMPNHDLFKLMATVYVFKMIFEVVLSPVTVYVIKWLKRVEHLDITKDPVTV